jgi:nitrile hydratase accessory protein
VTTTDALPGDLDQPRDNGELLFDAPWQARAVALAVALVAKLGLPWDEFRTRLIAAIAQDRGRPYYESWTIALEDLVISLELTSPAVFEAAIPTERAPL